jgi:hypothetical protein
MDGSIKEFDAEPVASPQGLTAGPEGDIWFAEANLNRIARLEIGPDVPPDTISPTIDIVRPRTGSTFVLGSQDVDASYSCDDQGGSGLATCAGPVPSGSPVPTDDLGAQTFLVQASDVAGNTAQDATTYVVFRSIGGTLIEGPGRAGGWLTLELGMDLDAHGVDPLVAAASQQVVCADPTNALGDPEVVDLRTRIGRGGVLVLRWDTDRAWAAQCRTLTLVFGPAGWSGAPATFVASFGAGASAKPAARPARLATKPLKPSR